MGKQWGQAANTFCTIGRALEPRQQQISYLQYDKSGGQVRLIHRFTLERRFSFEENKGLIVIGTFYFNGALLS
jgi:hypothetical protein